MSRPFLVRLAGITAHYRDPRYNTGTIGRNGIPIGTLHCPPPCTMHAMLCAAKGGWVDPAALVMGWRMDFDAVCTDFQTCQIPRGYSIRWGTQKLEASPRLREFLSFPVLSIFIYAGAQPEWFHCPANPLLFGRSEDLATEKSITLDIPWEPREEDNIARQCLPIPLGIGPLYSAPLYFEPGRVPVAMLPKIDARIDQAIQTGDSNGNYRLARLTRTGETFFLWDYSRAAG